MLRIFYSHMRSILTPLTNARAVLLKNQWKRLNANRSKLTKNKMKGIGMNSIESPPSSELPGPTPSLRNKARAWYFVSLGKRPKGYEEGNLTNSGNTTPHIALDRVLPANTDAAYCGKAIAR